MTDDLNEAVNITAIDNSNVNNDTLNETEVEEADEVEESDGSPNWITPLQSIRPEGLNFVEFDKHEYLFRQVEDPDGIETGKFAVFYRDLTIPEEKRKWETLKGLLSGMYTVAEVEKFFQQLTSEIDTVGEPLIRAVPFSLVCRSKTRKNINLFSDESVKIAFELVTGIETSLLDNVHSSIDTCIINSYDGSKCIHMDYVINSSIGSAENSRKFTDYFILSNQSHVFTHITHSLGAVHADLENIQQYYDSTINILKNCTSGIDDIVKDLTKRMKKSTKIQMNTYWESLPNDSKNLLFALIIASHCLENNYDVRQHIDLRTCVNIIVSKMFKDQQ